MNLKVAALSAATNCPIMCRFLGRRNAEAIHLFGSRRPRNLQNLALGPLLLDVFFFRLGG